MVLAPDWHPDIRGFTHFNSYDQRDNRLTIYVHKVRIQLRTKGSRGFSLCLALYFAPEPKNVITMFEQSLGFHLPFFGFYLCKVTCESI